MSATSEHEHGWELRLGEVVVRLILGDITQQRADALVNAANSGLVPGSGVDGAIQQAAGEELLEERRRALRRAGGRVPVGGAVISGAGRLPAKHVIHAVGPRWSGGGAGERALLESAYRTSLKVAKQNQVRSICFPAISAGIFGYPLEEAAQVAVTAVLDELQGDPGPLREVTFVLFNDRFMAAFQRALDGSSDRR